MRVTVREAAALLHAPEEKVYSWIESGDLPAYRINDQFRINRSELLEWATARKLSVDPALFHEEDEDERIPSVAESLERGGVFHDVEGTTREEALRSIIALLKLDDEGDRDALLHLLLARDAAAVVPVGDGIAIPHVRNPIALSADEAVAVARLSPAARRFQRAGRQAGLRSLLPRQPDDARSPPDAREDRFSPQRPGISRGDSRPRIGRPPDRHGTDPRKGTRHDADVARASGRRLGARRLQRTPRPARFPRGPAPRSGSPPWCHVLGCALGVSAAALALAGNTATVRFAWPLPGGGVDLHAGPPFGVLPRAGLRRGRSRLGLRRGLLGGGASPEERPQAPLLLRPRHGRSRARDGRRRRLELPRRLGDRLARRLLPRDDRSGRRRGAPRGLDLFRVGPRGHADPLRDVRVAPRRDRRLAPRAVGGAGLFPAPDADPAPRARRLRPQGGRDPSSRLDSRTRTRRPRATSRRCSLASS